MSATRYTALALVGITALIVAGAALVDARLPAAHQAGSSDPSAGSIQPGTPAGSVGAAGRGPAPPSIGELAPATSASRPRATTAGRSAPAPGRSTKVSAGGTATTSSRQPSLPGWRLIFHEDFATAAAPGAFLSVYRNFGAYPWGWVDTTKRGHYDPNILSVSGGTMVMYLHTGSDGIHRIAAPYPKLPGGGRDQLYGRYSVRFRADPVDGYKMAWLLWPQSELCSDGEIDFPEGDLTGTMSAFLHYVGAPTQFDYFGTGVGFSSWHVATVEWSPGKLSFWLDGRSIGTSTRHVPVKPMHYVLQTETEIGSDPVRPAAAGNVQVDWLSIWRYEP